jgi:hypothetical protein
MPMSPLGQISSLNKKYHCDVASMSTELDLNQTASQIGNPTLA